VPLNLEVKLEDAWMQVGKINQLSQWPIEKYRPVDGSMIAIGIALDTATNH